MVWNGILKYKPLILLNHITAKEAVEKNAYKIEEGTEKIFSDDRYSEDIIEELEIGEKFQEANKYLAYTLHKRAAVWWSYLCLKYTKNLTDGIIKKEPYDAFMEKKEALKKEIDDFVNNIPEYKDLQKHIADAEKFKSDKEAEIKAIFNDKEGALKSGKIDQETYDKITLKPLKEKEEHFRNLFESNPPEAKAQAMAMKELADKNFFAKHGCTLEEAFIREMKKEFGSDPKKVDTSHLDKIFAAIKGKIGEYKGKIDEEMKKVPKRASDIPGLPKGPSKEKVADAYESALNWVIAPTDINSQNCFRSGNEAGTSTEGLLALSAFWAHGDIAVDIPEVKRVIATPPGLTSNGVNSVIIKSAVALATVPEVGISYNDAMKEFYKIGLEIAQGTNLWDNEFINTIKKKDPKAYMEGKPGLGREYDKVMPEVKEERDHKELLKSSDNDQPMWKKMLSKTL